MITRRALRHPLLALVALPILTLTGLGQSQPTTLWQLQGWEETGVDDLNNDGVPDVAVNGPGGLAIHSGVDGSLLFPLPYPNGGVLAAAGDIDGDQVGDIIIGQVWQGPGGFPIGGQVDVVSGATLSVIHTFSASGAQVSFGLKVASAGDVNADGVPDVLVGADSGPLGSVTRFARVYSGLTGAQLYHWGIYAGLQDLDGAGDVNADGYDDVLVCETCCANPVATVYVFSGLDGSAIYTLTAQAGSNFGTSVAGLGDINGDGFSDFAIGAGTNYIGGIHQPGFVNVYSGASAAILHTFTGVAGSSLGLEVARAGDIDGDGTQDIIASSPGYSQYWPVIYVEVYSGASGSVLATFSPTPPVLKFDRPGPIGDLNQDGFDDILIRSLVSIPPNNVYMLNAYSLAAPGALTPLGPPAIGSQLGIQLTSPLDAGRPYVCGFAVGSAPGIPLPNGRVVPLNPDWLLALSLMPANPFFLGTLGSLDATGGATVAMMIPPEPLLVGATIQSAFAVGSSSAPWGIGTISAALPITFQ